MSTNMIVVGSNKSELDYSTYSCKNNLDSIKAKNLNYMINIRRVNRKNIIQNKRFKNVLRIVNPNKSKELYDNNDSNSNNAFPDQYSHLNKIRDSQKIYKIIKDMEDPNYKLSSVQKNMEILKHGSRIEKHIAIIEIRIMLTKKDKSFIQEIIDNNGVLILISLAKDTGELHLRLEATWSLANLASGNLFHVQTLISKNIINIFNDILDDEFPQIKEQAIWGLANLVGDSVDVRELIVNSNILNKMTKMLQYAQTLNVQKNLIWCISNALQNKPAKENLNKMKAQVKALILAFNSYDDIEVKSNCVLGFSWYCKSVFLSIFNNHKFLVNIRKFYQTLYKSNQCLTSYKNIINSIHRILGGITNGDDFDTSSIIDHGFLSDFSIMLNIEDTLFRREICWIISNIAAGTENQISHLLNEPHLFDQIIKLISDSQIKVKREAIWCLCNITKHANLNQIIHLIESNIFEVFVYILEINSSETMIILILEALPNIFECALQYKKLSFPGVLNLIYDCGLANIIEQLQKHDSDTIYQKALNLLETYFELAIDDII